MKIVEQENMNKSVLYSSLDRMEKIVCSVESTPEAKTSILFNDQPIESSLIKKEFKQV